MTVIRHRRGTAVEWAQANPILASGELGIELPDLPEMGRAPKFKIGDGVTRWLSLEYQASDARLHEYFQTALESAGLATKNEFESLEMELEGHIYSDAPHLAYDDMPSLLLIYENGLVT